MAYATNELFSENAGVGSGLRVIPETIQPKTFASGMGTVARLTPVVFDTSSWRVWEDTDTTVDGFVWPDPVTLDGSNEVLANVLMRGTLHFDDIPGATTFGATQNTLNGILRTEARAKGLIIQGLANVR